MTSILTKREASRRDRRGRIISSARRMVETGGAEALSMRALASDAGVSPMTLYAICGSKADILRALIDADRAIFARELSKLSDRDPFERLFGLMRSACRLLDQNACFYRAIYRHYFSISGSEVRGILDPGRHKLWRPFVTDIAEELEVAIDPCLLTARLEDMFIAAQLRWCAQEGSADRLEAETGMGFALLLLGVAGPHRRAMLNQQIVEYMYLLKTLDADGTAHP
jgi:AcrR family transcriptional regulator